MVQHAKKSFFAGTGGCVSMSKEDFQLKCSLDRASYGFCNKM